ncbi:hypothetical protein BAZSYMA_ACONTIG69957_0 [Bathymodiolus azoricus thioautotrophic gill symbiont]|uniref:Uncharacterized protein n=1 Tax=Bathymodiolus azoricus thioautotrophic gill symbiont TaxID=235205 RepID=A0A1H6M1E4_9GAMM|nr:hypothetical protein BAZSYMA_ACONTIG69957_0 [Bathymodiolus azoricus thioautotrophic gill symbiont]
MRVITLNLSNCFWYFVSRPGKCLSKSSNIFSKIFVFMTPGSSSLAL